MLWTSATKTGLAKVHVRTPLIGPSRAIARLLARVACKGAPLVRRHHAGGRFGVWIALPTKKQTPRIRAWAEARSTGAYGRVCAPTSKWGRVIGTAPAGGTHRGLGERHGGRAGPTMRPLGSSWRVSRATYAARRPARWRAEVYVDRSSCPFPRVCTRVNCFFGAFNTARMCGAQTGGQALASVSRVVD